MSDFLVTLYFLEGFVRISMVLLSTVFSPAPEFNKQLRKWLDRRSSM